MCTLCCSAGLLYEAKRRRWFVKFRTAPRCQAGGTCEVLSSLGMTHPQDGIVASLLSSIFVLQPINTGADVLQAVFCLNPGCFPTHEPHHAPHNPLEPSAPRDFGFSTAVVTGGVPPSGSMGAASDFDVQQMPTWEPPAFDVVSMPEANTPVQGTLLHPQQYRKRILDSRAHIRQFARRRN